MVVGLVARSLRPGHSVRWRHLFPLSPREKAFESELISTVISFFRGALTLLLLSNSPGPIYDHDNSSLMSSFLRRDPF